MKKIKNITVIMMIIICTTNLIISIYNIIKWKIDSNNTKKAITNITENVTIKEVTDNENTQIIEQIEEIPPSGPYWDYIKMNLIDVNFDELKKENPNTVGWIMVNGTNINYPVVQATDNDYYLTHSFNNTYNKAGWVFLDYRNNKNTLDKNNIIYAHSRLDKTMFGTLKNILSSNWINDPNNYVIKLSNESNNSLWQVFSIYRIKTTSDYLQIQFKSDEEFLEFSNKLLNRSNYNFNTTINETDKILTLSTCYNNNEKVVLHAKLIKIEEK